LIVARLVTHLLLYGSMLSWTPGYRLRTRLLRARRMACALLERIGIIPNSLVLGAMFQIQSYTLHLAVLEFHLFRLPPSRITLPSGWL